MSGRRDPAARPRVTKVPDLSGHPGPHRLSSRKNPERIAELLDITGSMRHFRLESLVCEAIPILRLDLSCNPTSWHP